ncbi:carbon-nitrogen hydrolase [Aspergillus campestris IBT 28561]|uniref:Carbon-nitrogen hydrolase n=1 Tax=Aspergillus campestris (strain IBT 28561) TaxID=1392248 RepID=A0A2I1D1L7_ASPC2|nr:carbon-nitrogen hydrolase [Aspergillus campestris IBT 28561]PKY03772.1 carbon-nitrogen hydrolase [Aspergillus campestris IBT 28561]
MAPTHRVAAIQFEVKPVAPEENHARACTLIREAAAQGAELAVLPEFHLNGFAPTNPLYATQATTSPHYLKSYQALATELSICIVPGTFLEQHADPTPPSTTTQPQDEDKNKITNHYYNKAYFIGPDGSILGSYIKRNLWISERGFISPPPASEAAGPARYPVFDTPIGRVGMLVCWDLAFPEAFRALIAAGAEIVVVPTYWTNNDASPALRAINPSCEPLFLASILTSRCFENTCGIIFANVSGSASDSPDSSSSGGKYIGMSRVVMPIVGTVKTLDAREGVCVADMDMGLLKLAEENYCIRGDVKGQKWIS